MKQITVFGSSRCKEGDSEYEFAESVGSLIGKYGHNVATGGYQGTMEAVSKGAAKQGVKVIGVKNLMNRLPLTASSLYAKNLFSFIRNLYSKEKKDFNINMEDEIIEKTLIKEIK